MNSIDRKVLTFTEYAQEVRRVLEQDPYLRFQRIKYCNESNGLPIGSSLTENCVIVTSMPLSELRALLEKYGFTFIQRSPSESQSCLYSKHVEKYVAIDNDFLGKEIENFSPRASVLVHKIPYCTRNLQEGKYPFSIPRFESELEANCELLLSDIVKAKYLPSEESQDFDRFYAERADQKIMGKPFKQWLPEWEKGKHYHSAHDQQQRLGALLVAHFLEDIGQTNHQGVYLMPKVFSASAVHNIEIDQTR